MELFNKSISYSEVQCFLYNLQLNTAVSGEVKLTDWFVNEVQELPEELNGDTLKAYIAFF
jgi:MAC/Perforin domain